MFYPLLRHQFQSITVISQSSIVCTLLFPRQKGMRSVCLALSSSLLSFSLTTATLACTRQRPGRKEFLLSTIKSIQTDYQLFRRMISYISSHSDPSDPAYEVIYISILQKLESMEKHALFTSSTDSTGKQTTARLSSERNISFSPTSSIMHICADYTE